MQKKKVRAKERPGLSGGDVKRETKKSALNLWKKTLQQTSHIDWKEKKEPEEKSQLRFRNPET